MKRFLSNILIIFGIFCYALVVYSLYERVNPQRVSFTYKKHIETVSNNKVFATPTEIRIPQVSVKLPIIHSKIVNGKWEATTAGVSYLSSSPIPGEMGNSILYGHNWSNLLGPLVHVKPKDVIEIVYSDKSKKIFEVEYTVTVTPDETHILLPSKDKRITLYTCTGFLDSKRFVVVGILRENLAEKVADSGK